MPDLNLRDILPWLGAVVAAPVILVWKRATGAVQKHEMKDIVEAINKRHDDHVEQDAKRFTGIFERLDNVAQATARIEGYIKGREER